MLYQKPMLLNTLILAVSCCLFPTFASAQDISNEQRNAYEARAQYNKNKSSYNDIVVRLSQQEQRLAEEQERLNQLKAEESAAKSALEQSKIDLDEKVRILNDVWDSRNQ